MFLERFGSWYFAQPRIIQELVLFGPPFLVSVAITLALGGRVRLMVLAWVFNPTVAGPLDAERGRQEDEAETAWTRDAKASVDELIARRRRGVY
ncbi:MAG TPA: hypothetical protein VGE54_08025 [Brevundimonas sp.]